ncbi:MAG: WD40 repeat domain-containing serine/threonine protein kinase, partial [bacterium]|nr:WD40 repeat domain-containing serine/threonine protein kinase [bacterium]
MTKTPIHETEVFQVAVKLAPDQRAVYLNQVCHENPTLRRDVESLLQAHDGNGSFLDQPALIVTASITPRETPGSMIGPYKIREQIGEGGFGVVYVAEQERPIRRKVALKIIKPGMDSKDVIARFDAERQALAMMDHPNVAKVLDAGTTDQGRLYFVMELVQGLSISEFCNKNRTTTRQRLLLLADVARAVHHAHQKGIIHRDLKPSNVMVTLHDGKPVVKVIDFGIAKALNQRISERSIYTAYGQMIGTPSYMSPEQAELSGLGVDTRSDIYSLGVLAYELLTGQTPLDAKRLRESAYAEILRIIREEQPPRPSQKVSTLAEQATALAQQQQTDPEQLRRELSGDIDWIIMKCLEKDRSRRYETANALVRDIERYLQDEPVEACPPSFWYQASKFSRKHRSLISTTAAFTLLLLTATGISGWLALHARRSSQLAEREAIKAQESLKEETHQRELAAQSEATSKAAQDQLRQSLYASKLNLIQSTWSQQQFGQVQSLLDSARPAPGEPDLRGFEWYYWQQKLRGGISSTQKLASPIEAQCVRYGASGERLFSGRIQVQPSDENGVPKDPSQAAKVQIQIFDGEGGKPVAESIREVSAMPNRYVNSRSDSPVWYSFEDYQVSEDASRCAIYFDKDESSHLVVFDSETGDEVMGKAIPETIVGLCFTGNASRLAAVSRPRGGMDAEGRCHGITYHVWDTATGNLVYQHAGPDQNWDWAWVAMSPDGRRMLRSRELMNLPDWNSTQQGILEVVDMDTDEVRWQREFENFHIRCLAWSPDGNWLAMRSRDNFSEREYVQLLNVDTGKTQAVLLHDADDRWDASYVELEFSRDSKYVASFSQQSIALWSIPAIAKDNDQALSRVSQLATLAHAGSELVGITFSSDNRELLGATRESIIRWSNTDLVGQQFTTSPRDVSPFPSFILSHDGSRLAVGEGNNLSIWNTQERSLICTINQQSDLRSLRPVFNSNGRRLLTLDPESVSPRTFSSQGYPCVFDAETGAQLRRFDTKVSFGRIDLHPNGRQIVAGFGEESQGPDDRYPSPRLLQIWDVNTGAMIKSVPLEPAMQSSYRNFLYIRDGQEVAVVKVSSISDSTLRYPFGYSLLIYDGQTLAYRRTITCTPGAEINIDRTRQSVAEFLESGDTTIRSLANGEVEIHLVASQKAERPGATRGRLAKTHDGSRVAIVSQLRQGTRHASQRAMCEVSIWNMQTGEK